MSANPANWSVGARKTTTIKVGTDKVALRVFNKGPGSVFVKEGKKLSVLLRADNACDLSASTLEIFITSNDSAASGWYDRV